jgi:hypothetical protein
MQVALSEGSFSNFPIGFSSVGVGDIVNSQTATGRFKIDSYIRMRLSACLPAGTREAIEADMKERVVEHDEEVVDTAMMIKYIETKLKDKKDLLELVVNKAIRSMEGTGWGVHTDADPSVKTAKWKREDDAEEPELNEEEAEL